MLILVIGGAASGKSAFAESLAYKGDSPRVYVATMQSVDAECEKRIARHHTAQLYGNLNLNMILKIDISAWSGKGGCRELFPGIPLSSSNGTDWDFSGSDVTGA